MVLQAVLPCLVLDVYLVEKVHNMRKMLWWGEIFRPKISGVN